MDHSINESKTPEYYRFRIFKKGETAQNGKRSLNVGMGYLVPGRNIYTIRLWTFLEDRFYMIASKDDSSKFRIMSREPIRNEVSKNKYYWNIVGSAEASANEGVFVLHFDLLEAPLYMSLFPDPVASSSTLVAPLFLEQVA